MRATARVAGPGSRVSYSGKARESSTTADAEPSAPCRTTDRKSGSESAVGTRVGHAAVVVIQHLLEHGLRGIGSPEQRDTGPDLHCIDVAENLFGTMVLGGRHHRRALTQ